MAFIAMAHLDNIFNGSGKQDGMSETATECSKCARAYMRGRRDEKNGVEPQRVDDAINSEPMVSETATARKPVTQCWRCGSREDQVRYPLEPMLCRTCAEVVLDERLVEIEADNHNLAARIAMLEREHKCAVPSAPLAVPPLPNHPRFRMQNSSNNHFAQFSDNGSWWSIEGLNTCGKNYAHLLEAACAIAEKWWNGEAQRWISAAPPHPKTNVAESIRYLEALDNARAWAAYFEARKGAA
jgi:hypothetical protein